MEAIEYNLLTMKCIPYVLVLSHVLLMHTSDSAT